MTIVNFLNEGNWSVSPKGFTAAAGDWISTGSWEARRRLNNNLVYKLDIQGQRSKFGWAARSWSGRLIFNSFLAYLIPTSHPSCKSISDALFYADREFTQNAFDEACQFFTSVNHVHCVFKSDDGGDLSPYFSSFGPTRWIQSSFIGGKLLHPIGSYYEVWRTDVNGCEGIRQSRTDVSYYGYSGGELLDENINHWLPTI